MQVELDVLQYELVLLDLGHVDDVVDEGEELLAAQLRDVQQVALLRVQLRVREQVQRRQHPRQRRPNLVGPAPSI